MLNTEQDVTAILERNNALYNEDHGRWGDGKIVASLPVTAVLQLLERGIMDRGFRVVDKKRFHAFLNDPENRYLRTRPGRL